MTYVHWFKILQYYYFTNICTLFLSLPLYMCIHTIVYLITYFLKGKVYLKFYQKSHCMHESCYKCLTNYVFLQTTQLMFYIWTCLKWKVKLSCIFNFSSHGYFFFWMVQSLQHMKFKRLLSNVNGIEKSELMISFF